MFPSLPFRLQVSFKHTHSFYVSIILQEIISSLHNIVNDKYGRKVLLYLLSPRDPAHTVREIIEVLQKGDGNAHRYERVEWHVPFIL